jgi:hypothetical protein
MFHRRILILLCIVASKCSKDHKKQIDDLSTERDLRPHITQVSQPQILSRQFQDPWYEKITISLSDQICAKQIVKSVANRLGVKISFQENEELFINYEARDKPFIKVLLDICELSNSKVLIDGSSAKISKDSPYYKSYHIPYLANKRSSSNSTSISNDIKETSNNSKIDVTSQIDFFEELRKNLENFLYSTEKDTKVIINAQASVISLLGTQRQQKIVSKYLKRALQSAKRQVLVEIKIYEVNLFNEFEMGINWAQVKSLLTLPNISITGSSQSSAGTIFNLSIGGGKPLELLSLLSKFGKTQSLSNPCLILSNNQSGVFKAVNNRVFFKFKKDTIISAPQSKHQLQNGPASNVIISYEAQTIPIGVSVFLQLLQNDSGEITIVFKPTVTDIENEIEDPGYAIVGGKGKAPTIPEIKTRELDTVFTLKENEAVIIGGLIYQHLASKNLNPLWAALAGYVQKLSTKRELVFVVKATAIQNQLDDLELAFVNED